MSIRNKLLFLLLIVALSAMIISSCDYVNYQQGQQLYNTNCVTCHMQDGSGVAELYPTLNKMESSDNYIEAIPCIIRNGLQRDGSLIEMVGLSHLSDVEINNIVNYLVNDMNNLKKQQTIQKTSSILSKCK